LNWFGVVINATGWMNLQFTGWPKQITDQHNVKPHNTYVAGLFVGAHGRHSAKLIQTSL
jgi:hypothetical protein